MKLIIVERSKTATFARLSEQLADDPDVRVVWDRRVSGTDAAGPYGQPRRLRKPFNHLGYFIVHAAAGEAVRDQHPEA